MSDTLPTSQVNFHSTSTGTTKLGHPRVAASPNLCQQETNFFGLFFFLVLGKYVGPAPKSVCPWICSVKCLGGVRGEETNSALLHYLICKKEKGEMIEKREQTASPDLGVPDWI